MTPKFVKELELYSKERLKSILDTSEEKTIVLIKKLKEYNVLKQRSVDKSTQDLSDLASDEIFDVVEDGENTYFTFTFVGVLCVNGVLIICYPKYMSSENMTIGNLQQIIKVIKKYNSKEETIRLFNGDGDKSSFNLLAVMLYLLSDYYDNGLYSNYIEIVEDNGMGEILWDRTINEIYAIIHENRPYYTTLKTRKTVFNDHDFFKRLHASVLYQIAKEFQSCSLLEVFEFDDECTFITEEELNDLGDTDYLLYRIEQELSVQFNTHKQVILKTLYAYLSSGKMLEDIDSFSLFGTNSFNLVWEKVCSEILDNKINIPIKSIDMPLGRVADSYKKQDKTELLGIIEKPKWVAYIEEDKNMYSEEFKTDTLIPDIIAIDGEKFVILDAKYYNLILSAKGVFKQPALESITKQYLYQLAYNNFIQEHGFKTVHNCFLFPTENDHIVVNGFVKMDMFSVMGLSNIEIRLLPASMAYDLYLKNKKLDLSELNL